MDRTQTTELIARKRARRTAPATPPVIAIAGMHRSGTSMVARLLQSCGLNLGQESDLAPAKPDNPDGFWENTNFVDINDEVLSSIGAGWDLPRPFPSAWKDNRYLRRTQAKAELLISSFRGTEPWGWKDPRNSVT